MNTRAVSCALFRLAARSAPAPITTYTGWRPPMTNPAEIVRSFYGKLKAGHAPGALGFDADDIEWVRVWHHKVNGRGPERVAEGRFKPLTAEWSSFGLEPSEFIGDGETLVSPAATSGACTEQPVSRPKPATRMCGRQNRALSPVHRYTGYRPGTAAMTHRFATFCSSGAES